MKMKNISKFNFLSFVMCGMLVLTFVFSIFLLSSHDLKPTLFAQANVGVDFKDANETWKVENGWICFEYSDNPDLFELSLKITNFDFSVGDAVTYYYVHADDVAYKTIKSAIVISQNDLNSGTAGDIIFNPYPLEGTGQYRVLAMIFNNETGDTIKTDYFKFKMEPPVLSNVRLKIDYLKIDDSSSEFNAYYLFSEVTLNGEKVNSDNFVIFWFIGQEELPFSNRSAFEWKPTEPGNYTISARIEGGNSNISTISIVVDYNRNLEVLAAVIGVAVLMVVFVILSTYIKVKSERIW